ncbi:MAG: response regulator [Desulfobacterales bacterium]|nr:response regulator [Desulfobacterales bacterium]
MDAKKILVIEDDALNMKLVKSILSLNAFNVFEANDAVKGIELAKKIFPDVILMDIQLPGMDGLTATKLIASNPELKNIPVIALTSYAMNGDKKKAIEAGCKGYITKPINRKIFMAELNRIIGNGGNPKESSHEDTNMERVLIVDDDNQNLKLLRGYLMNQNFDIHTASNGIECIDKVNTVMPDLILLDVMMPRLNGFETTFKLKSDSKTSHIPIILLTALDSSDAKKKGLDAGADEFLTKPVNRTELIARVNSMLRLKKYHDQLTTRTHSEKQFVNEHDSSPGKSKNKIAPRILIMEHSEVDYLLIVKYLEGESYELLRATTDEMALTMAVKFNVDVVLLDIMSPGINGFEVCRKLKLLDEIRHVQIVIMSDINDLDNKIMGVEKGADDYLIKPINCKEIQARVKVLLKKKIYMDQLYSHYEVALNSAITDGLTSLYNQTYFCRYLELETKRSERQKYSLALLMMDVNDFKIYNDSLGHLTGDVILREIAQVIRSSVREIDLVSRYGGDEFAAVLPYSDRKMALMVAERITIAIEKHRFSLDSINALKKVTISIGIAICPEDALSVLELINKSDIMMYESKKKIKTSLL